MTTYVYSSFGKDPDLADLVEMFVDEMPQRLESLRQTLAAGDWEGLGRVAHQLKGAAGSYGFHEVTPYAAQLEAAVRHEKSYDRALARLDSLVEAMQDICGRIRAG